jgi:hypothetical protein
VGAAAAGARWPALAPVNWSSTSPVSPARSMRHEGHVLSLRRLEGAAGLAKDGAPPRIDTPWAAAAAPEQQPQQGRARPSSGAPVGCCAAPEQHQSSTAAFSHARRFTASPLPRPSPPSSPVTGAEKAGRRHGPVHHLHGGRGGGRLHRAQVSGAGPATPDAAGPLRPTSV